MFKVLAKDVIVVQPLKIYCNWDKDDDYRINSISFDITNDVIDFKNTPELCDYHIQDKTLMNYNRDIGTEQAYYDHWGDNCMKMERKPNGNYRLTLKYPDDGGFNFETIYLRWKLPAGFQVMDTMDRLGGYVFGSTARNIVVDCNISTVKVDLDVNIGRVVARVPEKQEMYLGLEHSTTKRMNGYVLTGLKEMMENALKESRIKEIAKTR